MNRARNSLRSSLFVAAVCGAVLPAGATAQDAERAAHVDDAARPVVAFEADAGGVRVRQYQLGCLSQLTYLVVADGEACVVDPQRDVGHYLADAAALGARIRYVALTHTNADFVAGHVDLAQATGAEILIARVSDSRFPHRAADDGDRFPLGRAALRFLATPGHTLDSGTWLLSVPDLRPDPAYAFTGDALFVGSIGRPDLVGGAVTPMVLARRAYDSVAKFKALPDATIVLPGHGAGSLCGAHLSPETTSTIGREKSANPYFLVKSRASFTAQIVSGLPPAPAYFKHNVALNRAGPPVVPRELPPPPALAPEAFAAAAANGYVIDLRDAAAYAAGHLPGAINIGLRGRLDTWTGTVVPFEAPLLLVGSAAEIAEATFRFRRIGYDRIAGSLAGGVDAWRAAGREVRATPSLTPAELRALLASGAEPVVVDVRSPAEYAELRLGEFANLPLSEPERFGAVLDPDQPTLFVCNSAYRSSMAIGLAERAGLKQVASLAGGIDAWLTAGLPAVGTAPICAAPAAAPSASAPWRAPEPIEPSALAGLLADAPARYAVFDVRPAAAYAEFHVPGAISLAPEELGPRLDALPRGVQAVVVDRDGTTAFAVAGAALARTKNEAVLVRVLAGGTARWWEQIELLRSGPAPTSGGVPTDLTPSVGTPPAGAVKPPSSTPSSRPAKPRSAGC
jgi:rhodanese-related sulfurtransferase/glyoxylase-like metal-dependent hydrolase (beta-lactamase superfamily II)